MIGLSLSLCISDVVHGRVPESEVTKIIAGIRAANEMDFESVLSTYAGCNPDRPSINYWRGYEAEACDFARKLWQENKIEQPRLSGQSPYDNLLHSRWMSEDGQRLTWEDGKMVPCEA